MRLIQLLHYLSVASPEYGLFSDWPRKKKYLELSHNWFPVWQCDFRSKKSCKRRQKALKSLGKDSPLYKELRNKVQVECRTCKGTYYENTVSSLKDSNSTRWWR